ncbi:hypothetical protein SYNPS1DRAFT_23571 [Syncephalis pseudoplumigaleata]|uniref:Transmembrane protein n=1 Tax=Syncephalis pseudoplumigaleata TaxID=1712513 RepID=A0A4P9YZ84_9FUNG|nr:hypothetical protein SYNPS1DRAFT_23571 [Syncephalis pseudoplumigaleata]|eukprot:RKP24340.1 hypothetical protein SYNPS1DRAFT_23571 [Syncephalis pseudoplumigaleata]
MTQPTKEAVSLDESLTSATEALITVEVSSTSDAESEPPSSTTITEQTQSASSANLQVPSVAGRSRRTETTEDFQFEMVDEEYNWATSGMQTPSDLGEALAERNTSATSSTSSPPKSTSAQEQASALDRVQSMDSEGNWSESETASLMEEEQEQKQEDMAATAVPAVDIPEDIVTPVHSTDANTASDKSVSSSTESLRSSAEPTVALVPDTAAVEESSKDAASANTETSPSNSLLKTPKAAKRTNHQLPDGSNNGKAAAAAVTGDTSDRTAIHVGDERETSTLGDLSSILPETIPEAVREAAPDMSLDGEVEVEEEVDEAVVAAAKIATVVAASPRRRRREVETTELYAAVALVVKQQQEEARRSRLSISEPRAQIEAQFINRLQESITAASAINSISPNTSGPHGLLSSENDFDTVTSVLESRDRMMGGSVAGTGNLQPRSLSASMLRANSDEDKLTALLLQPSSLESLRKIVPPPETALTHLSVVLAGDAPDEVSRQHVLRAFARALHTGGKGGSATGNLDDYANIAQHGLKVTDVTGPTAPAQQQAAFREAELCVYFLRPPVSKTQLDGAAECARQITILPVCLSQGDRLYPDQRLITRGLTQRKVANTVLTPGTTSTVMQLAEMHPATLAFSLQLAQERTINERAARRRQKIRFILTTIVLFLAGLFMLVILPGEGSTGRDALDAALPAAWSRWLARWSPFAGLSTTEQSAYPHYYDTVYYREGSDDDDPHADWIYASDSLIIEELPEYETTRHRTYEPGMRGNLHWVMDVGLDAMDDARIWLFRTTEPLRRELLHQLRLFQKTQLGKKLMELRQMLRDQLARMIKRV